MEEGEEYELIRAVESHLGLEQNGQPVWGYEVDQRIFPEEAPTREQRKFAGWCLRNLSCFVNGYELACKRGEVAPLSPQHVQAFYYQEREELRYRWGNRFHDFSLTHVLGSAKRHIAWLKELKVFEETSFYDRMLDRLYPTHALLEQAVKPAGPPSNTLDGR